MKKTPDEPLFVFSLLHAESLDCLKLCIRNFRMFAAPGDKLIISSSVKPGYEHDPQDPDIHVVRASERKAHGADLLRGHIENWKFAQERFGGEKDFLFITMASNSLFFRRYSKPEVLASMKVSPTKTLASMAGWQYDAIRKCDSFVKAFGDKYQHNQIEGFATWGSAWPVIERKFNEVDYARHSLDKQICLEEVLPLVALASHKLASTNICRVKWVESKRGRRFVTPHDLLVGGKRLPPPLCMYKWFDRDPQSLTSQLVTQASTQQAFTTLYDTLEQLKPTTGERLELARSFLDEITLPQAVLDVGTHAFRKAIHHRHDRKVIRINDGLAQSPYLYLESLPEDFSAQLTVEMGGGRIRVSSVSESLISKPNANANFDLKFYVVLYIPIPDSAQQLYLTRFERWRPDGGAVPGDLSNDELVLNFGILEHRGAYEIVYAQANSFQSSLLKPFALHDVRKSANAGLRCFGIPVIPETGFSFELRTS